MRIECFIGISSLRISWFRSEVSLSVWDFFVGGHGAGVTLLVVSWEAKLCC